MTKETPGGTKKFLYSGPKPRRSPDEEEWSFRFSPNKAPTPSGLDLDEVWSIKKNVNVLKPDDKKAGVHGLDLNVKKNFYSRYGNVRDSDNTSNGLQGNTADKADSVKSWNQRTGYSYSYTSNSPDPRQTPSSRQTSQSQNGYRNNHGGHNFNF